MTSSRLDDARAKATWAEAHLQDFVRRTFAWAEDQGEQPLPIGKTYDSNIGAFIYHFTEGEVGPGEWSLILGDLLVSFRAVLDYIAWQLYQLAVEAGEPPTKREDRVGFPIVTTGNPGAKQTPAQHFAAQLPHMLPGLSRLDPMYKAIIERHQPFKRGATARDHPLAALQRLVNIDKHRRLHGTRVRPETLKVGTVVEQTNFRVTGFEPLHVSRPDPGTPFLRVYGDVIGDGPPEVKVKFGGGTSTIAVIGEISIGALTWQIWRYVRDVLDEFDRIMP